VGLRVGIVGAGPAGLYFALLTKRRAPDADVVVVERGAADATFGFGVVFSDRALEFLRDGDPQTFAVLTRDIESWPIQRIRHQGEDVDIDGNGFSAIGRLDLLARLQNLVRAAGVEMQFGHEVTGLAAFADRDLVVGADGISSAVRAAHAAEFGPHVETMGNSFVWYGCARPFGCLTLSFVDTDWGPFVAHYYRYQSARSTFIVECDGATWRRAGLADMDDAMSRAFCENLFAADLQGSPLISNQSAWRNFPVVTNRAWHHGNVVLIGDALHSVHFSIGSGTRLAMEDAIALDRALAENGDDVAIGLAAFEAARRPVAEKILAAAGESAGWYESFGARMHLEAYDFAYDYMTRSGRMSDERLRQTAPRFAAAHAAREEPTG
jgi:2-polyprenyl-6-methoxyphenol hydroxylase-like FAD-dependent oxidoreductase